MIPDGVGKAIADGNRVAAGFIAERADPQLSQTSEERSAEIGRAQPIDRLRCPRLAERFGADNGLD